jgi:hypothetical protein
VTVADKPAASATLTCVHRPPPNQSQVKASEAVARQPSATSAAVHVGTECNKPTRRVHPRSKRGWQGRLRSLLQCSWSIAGAPALVTAVRCHRRDTAQRPTARAFLSLREKLHSCFLERSRQQEATPSFAYCSLCMLLRRCACWLRPLGFPLQNIDAQRQQGRQPWGQPTEGPCTPRRAGSVCRAHPLPPAGLCAGRRAGNPSRFMCAHGLHRAVRVRCPCCCCVCS